MPAPWRATDTEPQSAQARGTGSRWPQWWQAISPAARCSTSVTSQSGHSHTRPQTRQERKFDQPRRLSSTIAFSPRRRTSSSASRVRWWSAPATPSMPTTSTGGSRRPSTRSGSRSRSWRTMLSGRGVALPASSTAPSSRGAALGHHAGVVARVALLLVGASRAPRRPRSGRGRRTGRTRPSAGRRRRAPRRGACATTRRSARAAASRECSTATASPKRSTKRPAVCGVSAISGTSTIAERPRSSAAATARR